MAQKNTPSGIESSLFLQSHSVQLRIWHWLTFLFLTGSIVTVLFNSTILSQRDNVKLVQDQLQSKVVTVTDDQAFAVSREYEDKMWGVHKLFGYGLAFLLLTRVIIEISQPEEEKLRNRLKKIILMSKQDDPNKAGYRHYLLVKRSYMLFFILLFGMALTGLGLAFGRELGLSRGIHGGLKNIHEIVQYLMYAFVVIHLAGVILAENGRIKGLVSGMIHGNRS
ncbi:MAG: cytochrome b/b6 domain-containing protein [Bacteroidota bacterium]|nr:cytochrome b/b6 domain-containing protein [Bacteroidota bacterium]